MHLHIQIFILNLLIWKFKADKFVILLQCNLYFRKGMGEYMCTCRCIRYTFVYRKLLYNTYIICV